MGRLMDGVRRAVAFAAFGLLAIAGTVTTANAQSPTENFRTGLSAYKLNNFALARERWTIACEQQNETTSCLNLGIMFEQGQGMPADPAWARRL